MHKTKLFKLLVSCIILSPFTAIADISVLMYHNISNKDNIASVSIDKFKEQMKAINDNNVNVLSLEEFQTLLSSKDKSTENSVLITFDDGWKSQLQAIEVLNEYKYPYVLFINGQPIVSKSRIYLSNNDLNNFDDCNYSSISDHSYTHSQILYKGVNLENDFKNNREFLKKFKCFKKDSYAFPYGLNSKEYKSFLRDNDIKYAFGTDSRRINNVHKVDFLNIPRYNINNRLSYEAFLGIINSYSVNQKKNLKDDKNLPYNTIVDKS